MSLQKGLVGHWTMDDADTSGSTLYDGSAYNNHGSIIDTVSTGTSGKINESYTFSSNGIVNVGSQIPQSPPISVTSWIRINSSVSSEQCVIGNYDSDGWIFRTRPDRIDEVEFWFNGAGHGSNNIAVTEREEFVFIAAVWDGTNLTLYKNSDSYTTTPVQTISSVNNDFRIASRGDSDTRYDMNGELDDVRVYNRALSESEINELYQMREQRTSKQKPSNITLNEKDVVLEQDSFGSWILVMNYEHYGGTNPTVSPGSTFPQMPNGKKTIKDIQNDGSNGELQHVDNISQYGSWDVDAVRLEGVTSNHGRKINYYTETQNAIDAIVDNSVNANHTDLASNITKYPDHNAFLPDGSGERNSTNQQDEHIFGYEFPMFGDMDKGGGGGNEHWAVAGQDDRWEVDDKPNNAGQTTIHRVWVRTNIY